ncbi:MAG: signal recognition particle-docking protein FtsY [Deltaproteobacteria bacterium]|nr:signal recognition particle-docking protein FtsY [Deltaproteobacteria bacterium]
MSIGKTEQKRPEQKSPESETATEAETQRGGFLGRLFGRRKGLEKPSPTQAEEVIEPVTPAEQKVVFDENEASLRTHSVEEVAEAAAFMVEADAADSDETLVAAGIRSGKIRPVGTPPSAMAGGAAEGAQEDETDAMPPAANESGATQQAGPDGAAPAADKKERRGFFSRLKDGLAKTRRQFVGTLDNLFYGDKEIDAEFLEELEEILLTSDLGVKTSYRLFSQIEEKVSHQELENPAHLRRFLQQEIGSILARAEAPWELSPKPYVIMTIGVNGVGKTTTIGKLAAIFTQQKKKVVLGAADTFRAAAVEQLMVWAERAGVPIVKQSMGADPAAVAFDTVQSAIKREADVVIIDTAGRLHTKVNLMDELKKIQRVLGKALPGAPHEVLLVLDANTGQNAITQAQMFHQAIGVTGLVMTKLDGTAKGGVIVGVCDELKVPVRYIGIGESIADLRRFNAGDFVDALFDRM